MKEYTESHFEKEIVDLSFSTRKLRKSSQDNMKKNWLWLFDLFILFS